MKQNKERGQRDLIILGLFEQMHMLHPGICGRQSTAGWPA